MINNFIQRVKSFSSDEKFKEILHGSLYSSSAKIFAKVFALISSVIIARYYGADIIGFVAIIGSVIGMAVLLSNFGMSTSILRLIPEYTQNFSRSVALAIYLKTLILTGVISIITGYLLWFFSSEIADNVFHKPVLEYFFELSAFILVFYALNSLNIAAIRAMKKMKPLALFEFLPSVITFILVIVLTFAFYNKYNPIYIVFSSTILMAFLTSFYIGKIIKNTDIDDGFARAPSFRSITVLSFPMFLTAGLQFISGQTDIFMLGMLTTEDQVGIYSIVFSLSMLTSFVLASINSMAAPKFSELYHQGKMDDLKHVAQKSTKMIFWISLPIMLVLILFGKFILAIYGQEFMLGYMALVFITIGQFINAASGSVGYFLNMTGHQKVFQNIILIAAIVNVVLNYVLIPKYGINGAAFATLVSTIFWNIVASVYVKNIFGFYISNIFTILLSKRKTT